MNIYTKYGISRMTDTRISRESARLVQSLDADTRYIIFEMLETGDFRAVICSQVSDKHLSEIMAGKSEVWRFSDREKAIRSLRRLNANVQIYSGVSA
jgi:hypothetical protein